MTRFYNIEFCLNFFNLMGVHPEKGGRITQKMKYMFGLFLNLSVVFLSVLKLVLKERVTITDITDSIDTIGVLLHGNLKMSILFIKRSKIVNLLTKMDSQFWKVEDVKDVDMRNDHQRFLQSLKNVLQFFTFLCFFLAAMFFIKAFIAQTIFDMYIPQWCPWYINVLYQGYTCVRTISFAVVGTDLFIFTMFMLTSQQFDMLNEEMKIMFGGKEANRFDQETIKYSIKRCVDHHIFLKNYVKLLNETFSEVLFIYNGDIILSLCVEMYIVSTQNSLQTAIKAGVYVFTGLFQYTVCYCIAAQAVTDAADKMYTSVYFSRWYEHPEKYVRTAAILIMTSSQKPVVITALSFMTINLETCLKTIQTIVSYCMFLRTMGIK